jgi:preprotein translocase subunit YajC
MFSNIALAAEEAVQTSQTAVQESTLMNFVPIILIFLIFYFLLIRPQAKKQKEQQALINSVKRGDKVIISGGIVATFIKDEEDGLVEVELAKDLRIKALKHTITSIINRDAQANKASAPSSSSVAVKNVTPKKSKKSK